MDLQAIQRDLQADAILKKCGLDFVIEKRPLVDMTNVILNPEDDSILPSKTPFYGLKNMKSGEYIHNVKKTYVVSQNKEVVSQVLKGIRGFGNLNLDSGASLKGGRKIFMQLGIDGYSQFGNNDQIKRYITVIDSNDGSAGIGIGIGDTVKSCDNQFFHFYKQSFTKIRHCKSLEQKMEELPALITIAVNESMKMIDLYTQFESTVVSRDLAHRMVENIIGCSLDADKDVLKQVSTFKKNQMKNLTKSINYEMNQKGDNLWGLHNGVTRWTTHDRRVPKRKNGRIESLVLGSAYKENNKSLDFCKKELEVLN